MARTPLLQKLCAVDFAEVAKRGCFVYCYLRADGSPYYVGIASTAARPFQKHTCAVPARGSSRVRVMRSALTWDQAAEWEIRYISRYGRKDLGTGILRNLTDGGDGAVGLVHTDEAKALMSQKMQGNQNGAGVVPTPEKRAAIAAALIGVSHSPQRRAKQSQAKLGKPLPAASVLKRSQTVIAQNAAKAGYSLEEWALMDHTAKIKAARNAEAAAEFGMTTKEYAALSHGEKLALRGNSGNDKRQEEAAKRAGVDLETWLGWTTLERDAHVAAKAKADRYQFPLDVWLGLGRGARISVAKRFNQGKRGAELLAGIAA